MDTVECLELLKLFFGVDKFMRLVIEVLVDWVDSSNGERPVCHASTPHFNPSIRSHSGISPKTGQVSGENSFFHRLISRILRLTSDYINDLFDRLSKYSPLLK